MVIIIKDKNVLHKLMKIINNKMKKKPTYKNSTQLFHVLLETMIGHKE